MGNSAAVSYANYGAGRIPRLTQLARSIEYLEVSLRCAAAALHIAGKRNSVADALSRFTSRVRGLDPYPRREFRDKYRKEVIDRCGNIDVDMLACDDGSDAWVPNYRCPSNTTFEGPPPSGQLWRFPRIDMVDLVLTGAVAPLKEDWPGAHLRLRPLMTWKSWYPKLSYFERTALWTADASLFVDRGGGTPRVIRDDEEWLGLYFEFKATRNGAFLSTTVKYV